MIPTAVNEPKHTSAACTTRLCTRMYACVRMHPSMCPYVYLCHVHGLVITECDITGGVSRTWSPSELRCGAGGWRCAAAKVDVLPGGACGRDVTSQGLSWDRIGTDSLHRYTPQLCNLFMLSRCVNKNRPSTPHPPLLTPYSLPKENQHGRDACKTPALRYQPEVLGKLKQQKLKQ